jgi:hexosaminidase
MIVPMTVPPPVSSGAPSLWPPLAIPSTGWLTLTHTPTVEGPWTTQVRSALRVLDPLPGTPTTGRSTTGAPGGPAHDRAPHIRTLDAPDLPVEGYALSIDPTGITIAASSRLGALQATTTIRQLLPAEAWRIAAVRRDDWRLPLLTLTDAPAHEYRGFMLDVSRHFAPVPEVLRWIELLAMHRLNRLHLHLTDDQGWRVESPTHPALSQVASWRTASWVGHSQGREVEDPRRLDGTPHGGFYSLADLREITTHAAQHGVTIVPEVDLPGHASALLAAIPELGVPGCPPQQVATRWGLLGRTISPLPSAMRIIEVVLGEVAEAIDSPYLHIGGDEAELGMWRGAPEVLALAGKHGGVEGLRSAVNAQLARVVLDLGRTPITWDDAFVAGGLPPATVVMPWRSAAIGHAAAAAGHDVVMTPVLPTYFDYAEDAGPDEPLSIGAPLGVDRVAAWVPEPAAADSPGRILGGQAQLWTEYCPDSATREYRAFPRLSVLGANLWRGRPLALPEEAAPLAAQVARLDARHVNHRPLAGPHPWQRAGTGNRAPLGIYPIDAVAEHLAATVGDAEPPA